MQTSCCELQFSVHEESIVGVEAIAPLEAFGLTTRPIARQERWQLRAAMSQLLAHAVEFRHAINGVGVIAVGVI